MSGQEIEQINVRLIELRTLIQESGGRVDSHKAKTGAAMGGAVFALLLAAGGFYDILKGKSAVWASIGIGTGELHWIAGGLLAAGIALLIVALTLDHKTNRKTQSSLIELQDEMARLQERRDQLLKSGT